MVPWSWHLGWCSRKDFVAEFLQALWNLLLKKNADLGFYESPISFRTVAVSSEIFARNVEAFPRAWGSSCYRKNLEHLKQFVCLVLHHKLRFWKRGPKFLPIDCLGGGFKYFFTFIYLRKISNLADMFQMGWNHHLVVLLEKKITVFLFHFHEGREILMTSNWL